MYHIRHTQQQHPIFDSQAYLSNGSIFAKYVIHLLRSDLKRKVPVGQGKRIALSIRVCIK